MNNQKIINGLSGYAVRVESSNTNPFTGSSKQMGVSIMFWPFLMELYPDRKEPSEEIVINIAKKFGYTLEHTTTKWGHKHLMFSRPKHK